MEAIQILDNKSIIELMTKLKFYKENNMLLRIRTLSNYLSERIEKELNLSDKYPCDFDCNELKVLDQRDIIPHRIIHQAYINTPACQN